MGNAYLLPPKENANSALTIELKLGCACADCCPLARVRIYTVSPKLPPSFAQEQQLLLRITALVLVSS